jgi:hypothetical protein
MHLIIELCKKSLKKIELCKKCYIHDSVSLTSGLKVILVDQNVFCNAGFSIIMISKNMFHVNARTHTYYFARKDPLLFMKIYFSKMHLLFRQKYPFFVFLEKRKVRVKIVSNV